jgi:hypothetical protein
MFRLFKINKAKCLYCDDILTSPSDKASQAITCSCGHLTISGGATALVRNGFANKDYKEMSLLNSFNEEVPAEAVIEETAKPPPQPF